MVMESSFLERHPQAKDALGFATLIVLVILGTLFINTYIFRSFSVQGISSENTMSTGDHLIINRVPVTVEQLKNKTYIPPRGQFIVFKNPAWATGQPDEFIVKRVIAYGGERVTVKDGILKVYNSQHPEGFEPDKDMKHGRPKSPTSGNVDEIVTDGMIFVSGDNRIDQNSYDSRNGLGLIPLGDIIGPVSLRIWPIIKLSTF